MRLLDTNDDGVPDTLYIADDPDPSQAVNVWRFNYQGWAGSTNGYNGPFSLGVNFDDGGTMFANVFKVKNIDASNITAGTINADNINVTNINGQNIKDGTIGSNPLASGAVIESKIGSEAVTTGKLGSLSVTNGKIGGGAVSYGKTSFTGTLDQVGVNQSDIAAINSLFATTLGCNSLTVSGNFTFNGFRAYWGTIDGATVLRA